MNFLKIASFLAASAAFATVASAQTLGTNYVGIGTKSIEIDVPYDDIEGWSYGIEYNHQLMEWEDSGFDVNVSLGYSTIDNNSYERDAVTVSADAIYYLELGQFRPFVGGTLGLAWQEISPDIDWDNDENTLIIGALVGAEYVVNEQISIKGDARWIYLEDQEIDQWTLNLEANYWIHENFGAAINISVGEFDDADLFSYGISLRYRL